MSETPNTTKKTAKEEVRALFEMFKPHLQELRTRLSRVGLSVLVGMVVGLFLVMGPVQLVDIIITAFAPTDRGYPPLQAVGTAEVFTSYMLIAFVTGIILAMPFIIYQIMAFIYPGLEDPKERRFLAWSLPFIIFFFAAGIVFGWYITVPVAIRFLIGFGNPELIANQPALSDFLRTVSLLVLVNGIVFELPVFIYVLTLLKFISRQQLKSFRRYAVLIVTIIAAVVTPTGDPINLMLLAIPMYLLYELGIIITLFIPKK